MLSSRSVQNASEVLILSGGLEHISIFNAFYDNVLRKTCSIFSYFLEIG